MRCNLESDVSTEAAIANANTYFDTCRFGFRANRTSCTADRTVTMLAAHARIAVVREACSACAYPSTSAASRPEPPNARFNAAAETAYNTAVDTFIAGTFTRCNTAAVNSSVTASVDLGGNILAAYPEICAVRMACIAAGNQPALAPALPRGHPGASPHLLTPFGTRLVCFSFLSSSSASFLC